jgi:hypothetical protein
LLGVDSAATAMPLRKQLWQRLAGELKTRHLEQLVQTVPFAQLPQVFPKMIAGETRGRAVVEIAGD